MPGLMRTGMVRRMHGGAAPPVDTISPDDIAGLSAWWKADFIAGLSDGDAVGTWEDAHTTNKDQTQATAANKPTYKTAILNGLPVVRFDATNDGMTSTLAAFAGGALENFTIAAVYNCSSAASASRRAIQGSDNWLFGPYAAQHKVYSGGFIGGPAVVANAFVTHVVTQSSTTTTSYVDGASQGTNGSPGYPNNICLGASGGFAEPLSGDIAEVVVYDSVLSAGDRGDLELYLSVKWGL